MGSRASLHAAHVLLMSMSMLLLALKCIVQEVWALLF
jgi:hypothetical protein